MWSSSETNDLLRFRHVLPVVSWHASRSIAGSWGRQAPNPLDYGRGRHGWIESRGTKDGFFSRERRDVKLEQGHLVQVIPKVNFVQVLSQWSFIAGLDL